VAVLLLAVALDLALGDPPNRFHPVSWIGALIAAGRRAAEHLPARLLVAAGVGLIALVADRRVPGERGLSVRGGMAAVAARPSRPGLALQVQLLSPWARICGVGSARCAGHG
jgi:Cobalamin biosynthesis protein CobD/CbiB